MLHKPKVPSKISSEKMDKCLAKKSALKIAEMRGECTLFPSRYKSHSTCGGVSVNVNFSMFMSFNDGRNSKDQDFPLFPFKNYAFSMFKEGTLAYFIGIFQSIDNYNDCRTFSNQASIVGR